jgi:hypothetical protein
MTAMLEASKFSLVMPGFVQPIKTITPTDAMMGSATLIILKKNFVFILIFLLRFLNDYLFCDHPFKSISLCGNGQLVKISSTPP